MSHSLNLCNLPPWIVGSREFNGDPRPLEIQGVLRANRFLFERLDNVDTPTERATVFNDYMSVQFHLHEWQNENTTTACRSIRNSYLRFLQGWGVDSNSIEGAVLKGWVESRFGIPPTYHKGCLKEAVDEVSAYVIDRMVGSARTNAISSQLDVLYAYTQYELKRQHPAKRWLRLYRGTYDATEHEELERLGPRQAIVRLNNLVSFTSERERAWEFGTTVWSVEVPTCKVFFYGDLFPNSILKGENEYLIIGGEYLVNRLLF